MRRSARTWSAAVALVGGLALELAVGDGSSYACVKRSQAREGFGMDSPKAGVIEVGARARHSSRCRTRGPL